MKKWVWLIGLGALLLLSRVEHTGVEISRLEPVELVRLTVEENIVSIETDTGGRGYGQDLDSAIENLHASSSAMVFLDTAEYLLLNDEAQRYLPQLYEVLRPACQVCVANGDLDLTEAAEFLETHSPKIKLLQCRAGERSLPTLYIQDGRGQLVQ